MTSAHVSDELEREFKAEFGDDADQAAERALANELTNKRIDDAIRMGVEPAQAMADALAKDPHFRHQAEDLTKGPSSASTPLEDLLHRYS